MYLVIGLTVLVEVHNATDEKFIGEIVELAWDFEGDFEGDFGLMWDVASMKADSHISTGRLKGLKNVGPLESLGCVLLLMLGPAAQHRIEAQPEKGGDGGEDDDFQNHYACTCGFACAPYHHTEKWRRAGYSVVTCPT